jgi:hypothetical protein
MHDNVRNPEAMNVRPSECGKEAHKIVSGEDTSMRILRQDRGDRDGAYGERIAKGNIYHREQDRRAGE